MYNGALYVYMVNINFSLALDLPRKFTVAKFWYYYVRCDVAYTEWVKKLTAFIFKLAA